jgi:hypothetical protein
VEGFREVVGIEGGGVHPGINAFDEEIDEGFSCAESFTGSLESRVELGPPWEALGMGALDKMV